MVELGSTASYLAGRMVLPAEHPWVKRAEVARGHLRENQPGPHSRARRPDFGYRQTLNQPPKKDYITAYIASHSKARLGWPRTRPATPCARTTACWRCACWLACR